MSRLQHYQKHHLWYEIGFIILYFAINNTILATSVIMEAQRGGGEPSFALWEPFVWEYSSALSTMILIWPLVLFLQKFPFNWNRIAYSAIGYFVASIAFSFSHIGMMVGMRKVVYWTQEMSYQFGEFWFEMFYEYRKDLWGFIFFIMVYHSYQFIVSRLQGEASLVSNSEDDEPEQNSDRLLVKKLGKEFIIKISDIEWLESSGNYVNLHIQGRIYPTRSTLSKLVEQIEGKGFCRIHRSYAVNLDVIDSITPLSSGDGEIKLNNGKVLNLSRRYKDDLKQRLH